MLSFLSGFNQKNVTIFWHKPLHFSIVREWGPSLAIKVSLAHCHCWAPTPQGCCYEAWVASGPRALRHSSKVLSRPGGPREGGTETRGTVKQGRANEGVWGQRNCSRSETTYDRHGSQIWWAQPILLFAMITKHAFDSWIVKPAIKGKSYMEGISNVHLQSFIEWTPIMRMLV